MYRFTIGDKVRHFEDKSSVGVICEQLTFDEDCGEPLHELNPNDPWYHIEWISGDIIVDMSGPWVGFESDGVLESIE